MEENPIKNKQVYCVDELNFNRLKRYYRKPINIMLIITFAVYYLQSFRLRKYAGIAITR